MEYYVYVHKRLTDNSVFYVGRGKGKRKTVKQNRNNYWKNIVEKHGFSVEIIEQNLTLELSNEREIYWIQKYKDDGIVLANITTGGGGVSGRPRTDEEKRRISIALTGKVSSEERSIKMLGNKNGAGSRSEEFRKKMSEVMKGKPKSEAHKQSLRNAFKGKPLSPEHKAKVIAANAKRRNKDLKC